jgi:hypothetical protein
VRVAATAAFVAIALAGSALFNVSAAYRTAQPWLPVWKPRGEAMPDVLDNLRMPLHLEQRQWLRRLDAATPPGAVVYLVDFAYYGDAQHGVYERAGAIRRDLVTRYVARRRLQPAEREFFVCFWRAPDRSLLDHFGTVDEPQPGVFRVRRP